VSGAALNDALGQSQYLLLALVEDADENTFRSRYHDQADQHHLFAGLRRVD
jgi:hypothetical protein